METHPARLRPLLAAGLVLAFCAPLAWAFDPHGPSALPAGPQGPGLPADFEWNARTAEHLFNRAGFGATPEQLERAVEAGLDATVAELLRAPLAQLDVSVGSEAMIRPGVPRPETLVDGPHFEESPPLVVMERMYLDKGQLGKIVDCREYASAWLDSMLSGADPLRDRMTLFWHGHFVSSYKDVTHGIDMVEQLEFLRANALGDLGTLVRGIARDPAMLEYLNNDINVKSWPNENWARELMELFLLGEGHYTEDDIKEAARAFTGWTRWDHEFSFRRDLHDYGPKTLLGVTGNLDGDAAIDVVMAQPRCAEFLAEKLLTYFEGVVPPAERTERFAGILRDRGWRFDEFLRELLTDPGFYRPEVMGSRIAAPVEYYVGMARRLGLRPPSDMIYVNATLAGQQLFAPPNVKGWEEGSAWLTTGSVMGRSNGIGILLGEFDTELDPFAKAAEENKRRGFQGAYRDYLSMLAWLSRSHWDPPLDLAGALALDAQAGDAAVIAALLDHLLAVEPPAGTAEQLVGLTGELRTAAGVDGPLLAAASGAVLEELVHVILSLPEAQLL